MFTISPPHKEYSRKINLYINPQSNKQLKGGNRMFRKKKNSSEDFKLYTNVRELKSLVNEFKSLVAMTENKQMELKEVMSEFESLTALTENKLDEINKFKWKYKIK